MIIKIVCLPGAAGCCYVFQKTQGDILIIAAGAFKIKLLLSLLFWMDPVLS
jgi:hypothetical protein